MVDGGGPVKAELAEDELEHLEVVVLLVAHHIYHLVEAIFFVTAAGGAQILGHIHRGAVAAQQELLVQSVGGEVAPHRAVVAAVEDALGKAFVYQ